MHSGRRALVGSVLFTIQYFSMEPKALCFRVVRLSVCACVCTCLRARAETFFDRLAVDLVVLLSCTFMHFNEKNIYDIGDCEHGGGNYNYVLPG